MLTSTGDPILVVGGGLCGASVALALARKGFRVCLLEQASEFGVIGYGIQLGPNAFYMFDRLGVSEAVLAQSIVPHALLMLDSVDAGVIARIVLIPPGALAGVPLPVRLAALTGGFFGFLLIRRSAFAGVVVGEGLLVAGALVFS